MVVEPLVQRRRVSALSADRTSASLTGGGKSKDLGPRQVEGAHAVVERRGKHRGMIVHCVQ